MSAMSSLERRKEATRDDQILSADDTIAVIPER